MVMIKKKSEKKWDNHKINFNALIMTKLKQYQMSVKPALLRHTHVMQELSRSPKFKSSISSVVD